MSCFMVEREHVEYMLKAAQALSRAQVAWYHGGQWHYMPAGDSDRANEIGQMLWDENLRSVLYRYPDCASDNVPGKCGEVYDNFYMDGALGWHSFRPVQVLKAVACYEYQACECPD